MRLRRRVRELEARVAELERVTSGGHPLPHDFKLDWHSATGTGYVERCQLPGCTVWRGKL